MNTNKNNNKSNTYDKKIDNKNNNIKTINNINKNNDFTKALIFETDGKVNENKEIKKDR